MPGLSWELIKHRLPIRANARLVKQAPQRFSLKVIHKIKDGIHHLLKAKFIKIDRYVEWVSNIVLIMKKMAN